VSVYVLIPDDRRPAKVPISLTKYLQNNCTLNCCLWEDNIAEISPFWSLGTGLLSFSVLYELVRYFFDLLFVEEIIFPGTEKPD